MNRRLVWNFEISGKASFDLPNQSYDKEELRWEARYFWPAETIITLQSLDERFLALSIYETKHREDIYSLLPKRAYNIKKRRGELLYKPLLKISEGLYGFGKKINLATYPADQILPGTETLKAADLLDELAKGEELEVSKEALIYKFSTTPAIKLELARLRIKTKIYFSLCVEGRSQALVASFCQLLLPEELSCDYVSFLKQLGAT